MEKKGLIIIIILAILYWATKTASYTDAATQITINYHVKYPTKSSSNDSLPLIIALHGNGDTYDNFYQHTLNDIPFAARVVLLEAPNKFWPYDSTQLAKYSSAIASFTNFAKLKFATQGDPVLFGFSGGGVVAYYSALTQCHNYSLVVPVSGKLDPNMLPSNISTDDSCHVTAFHGISDQVVGYSGSKFAIENLKKFSKNISLISFNGGHQGIFKEQKQVIFNKIFAQL